MRTITFILILIISNLGIFAQYTVPVTNADFESSTAMNTSNDQIYFIDGFYINEAMDDSFDEVNSGLAPSEGVNNSQALKIITRPDVTGWHAQFGVDRIDISGYGYADFTFNFKLKASTVPAGYPIWMIVRTFDEDGVNVSSNTLVNYTNGGSIASLSDIDISYQDTSISFSLQANDSGKDATYVELLVQMAKYGNTYLIDDFSLMSSAPLSVKSFESIGVNMYPNPTVSFTTIKSTSALQNITLTSLLGKTLFTQKLNATEFNLDVSSYVKGVYILEVTNEKGKSSAKLIID